MHFLAAIAPTTITALIAAVATWLVANVNKRGTVENSIIDQLQEDNGELRQQVKDQGVEIKTLQQDFYKLQWALAQEQAHVKALTAHITAGSPPPPPVYNPVPFGGVLPTGQQPPATP